MDDAEIADEIRTALFMAVTVSQAYADDMLRELADRLEEVTPTPNASRPPK